MGMNNVFYRSRGFLDGQYDDLRPGLRMNIIAHPGVDKSNFELWSFAVSSINGCPDCVPAHEYMLREAGISRETILEALKAAAIVSGVAQAMTTAQTLAAAG
jgi:lipoyl-dependent peroxiredoxin subunit D